MDPAEKPTDSRPLEPGIPPSGNGEVDLPPEAAPDPFLKEYLARGLGNESLFGTLIVLSFLMAWVISRLLGLTPGEESHARLINTVFVFFNVGGAFLAWNGLQMIPPRSLLYSSMQGVTIALVAAAIGNGLDLALWVTGTAPWKGHPLPNAFFLFALLFGTIGIVKLGKAGRSSPGRMTLLIFFVLILITVLIPFHFNRETVGAATGLNAKEIAFGLFYALCSGYICAVAVQAGLDSKGWLGPPARIIAVGTGLLSLGCAAYAGLFSSAPPMVVASNIPLHFIIALAYCTVGFGVIAMGNAVVSVFPADAHHLPASAILTEMFGPSLGTKVYESMASRIRESQAALIQAEMEARVQEGSITRLEQEIQQRIKAEEELRKAKETAEAANQAKSQFLAMMSHELRTPLTTISAYGKLMGDSTSPLGQTLTPEVRDISLRISLSADHLQRLIEGILHFARAESGPLQPKVEVFHLVHVLNILLPSAELQSKERGVPFRTVLPAQDLILNADPQYLRQILFNLVSNAFKFTQTGEVRLEIRVEDGGLRLQVTDTGIGIPPDLQEKIFEPFFQVSNGYTRRFGGAGLGLTIVKRCTEALNGTLNIDSTPGKGTTIAVFLPGILSGGTP